MKNLKRLLLVFEISILMTAYVGAKEIMTFNQDKLLSEHKQSENLYQKYINEGLPHQIKNKGYATSKVTYEYYNNNAFKYENDNKIEVEFKNLLKRKKPDKNVDVIKVFYNNEIVNNYDQEIINQNDEEKNVGWVKFNEAWYYQDENGNNKSGWQYIGDKWYYLDRETYIMVTGLKEINGKKYFFKEDGSMATNYWKNIDGKDYYFDANGAMIVNETRKSTDGKKYYFDGNGVAVDLGISNEFFNYAYNASALNELRKNCKYWVSFGQAGIYSLKASLETYQSTLNQCYRIDSVTGNQKGVEEEKKAFAEIQEWLY